MGGGHPNSNATDSVVIKFLEENILYHFGFPINIITDNAQIFKSTKFISFYKNSNITIGNSTTYYPQGNGLVESSYKTLASVEENHYRKSKKLGYLAKILSLD